MALLRTHTLSYTIERRILARLRSLKVTRPALIAEDLATQIMDEIPLEAFEKREISELGYVFFHIEEIDESNILKVQEELLETHVNLDKKSPITIYMSTLGGGIFAALALCSTIQEIRRTGRKVNIHIQGCAMSMGSLIAQACDHRSIEPQAWFMIHEFKHDAGEAQKTSIIRDEVEFAERLERQTFLMYSMRTGKPVEYWRKKMHRRDWFLSADEALAEGLVDEIKPVVLFVRRRRAK